MIHRISISNYFSIRDEVVIDLRIPKTAPDLPRFRQSVARPDVRLPSVVVLMGPNGSGKTKLLRALNDAAHFVSSLTTPPSDGPKVTRFQPFRGAESSAYSTRIRIDLEADWLSPEADSELYSYELCVAPPPGGTARVVVREALYHFPRRRPRRLLERGLPGSAIYAADDFGFKAGDERLKAVRDDASIIATLAAFNVPLAERMGTQLGHLFAFSDVSPEESRQSLTDFAVDAMEDDPELAKWLDSELQRSDLGVAGVRGITFEDGRRYAIFDHRGLGSPVLLMFESTGTTRLFHLLPQLHFVFALGTPVVIDDFDSGLHVDMASRILHYFQSREINGKGAQLFAAAHNVGLLDDLEKEELFIVEKDESGVTRVHGAQDVRGLRRVNRLYPKYRSGTLGGVPRFG